VQFAFDSAEIAPAAKGQLDAIAAGIRMLPTTQKVVIEGHTDALGTEHYNEGLSQRRAQSVRQYLVAVHGIDAARLQAVGLGESAPLPGRSPNAAENRRVQFHGE
jgi:outer membrane protein OmpA-like peptidoglycan-associated protein